MRKVLLFLLVFPAISILHSELNIDSDSEILSVEDHDVVGRTLEKKHFLPSKSVKLMTNNGKGLFS